MDLSTIAQVVSIIGGIIGIILNLPKVFPSPSSDAPQSQVTKLIFAIGIVIFLYGGFNFSSAIAKIDANREACLQGRDQNANNIAQICDQYAASRYNQDAQSGLAIIGTSFVILAIVLFFQNFKTATIFLFTLELLWLAVGLWLIQSSL